MVTMVLLSVLSMQVQAWGNSNSGGDDSVFGNTFVRDWLSDSKSLSFKVDGCVWGYVDDSEEVGCLEDESEDGTTNWYMMANCRRPQVAFSVYASNSGSTSCSSSNFVESFVTTSGVSEFIYYLQTYDGNFNYNGDDSYGFDNLPNCESTNYGYLGLDCASDGSFAINYYNDEYCVSRTGKTYNQMKYLNKMMKNYESCNGAYSYGDDTDYSLVHQLVYYSEPCTSTDYSVCKDSAGFTERSSSSGKAKGGSKSWSVNRATGGHKSWVTKLKYSVGSLFLLASFIMFTGILFTNRRRRRAMMMRKYRQAKKKKKRDRARRESDGQKSRSSSKRRSTSRSKDKGGVLT